jgi:hypothetical protein
LLKVGAIDKTTMRDFDKSCFITTPEIDLAQIEVMPDRKSYIPAPGFHNV